MVNTAAWALCLLFAATTAALAYALTVRMPKSPEQAPPEAGAESGIKPAAVPAEPQEAAAGTVAINTKGYIIPTRQILVSPEVSGRIVELNIVEGARVEEGTILARLDERDFQDDEDRAGAALVLAQSKLQELLTSRPEEMGGAQAELHEAEAQLVQLESEWNRNRELVRQNVVSAQDFELTESKYLAAKRRVERLRFAIKLLEAPRDQRIAAGKAEVAQAQAELRKAQWRRGKCIIRAPITGTILKKNAERGNLVNPVAFNGSYSLCDMANLADLEVEVSVQEREVSKVFQGQRCQVRAEAYPDRPYDGYVTRLMPIADRGKGAVPVRVKILVPADEEGKYLKPEMGALVAFYNEKSPRAPAAAVPAQGMKP